MMNAFSIMHQCSRSFATGKRNKFPRLGASLYPSTSPITAKVIGMLTKKGIPLEKKICQAVFRLRITFQLPDPLSVAVEAVKPVITYRKHAGRKHYVPSLLRPDVAANIAMKWIIASAKERTFYSTNVPELENGLFEEISSIFNGTSKVYSKRFQMHKNPN